MLGRADVSRAVYLQLSGSGITALPGRDGTSRHGQYSSTDQSDRSSVLCTTTVACVRRWRRFYGAGGGVDGTEMALSYTDF